MLGFRALHTHALCICLSLTPGSFGESPDDEAADQLARSIPRSCWRDFDQLSRTMATLVAQSDRSRRSPEVERFKVRLVYRWITGHLKATHMNSDAFPVRPSYRAPQGSYYNEGYSPQSTLSRGYTNCEGFSLLFEALASRMGLEVNYLGGYARCPEVSDYHAWNAVKIGTQWRMIDATWGSVPKYRECWFLVSTQDFLNSHVPDAEYLGFSCYRGSGLTQSIVQQLQSKLITGPSNP